MARWNSIVPLGIMAVTTAGTTTPLSANCGALSGQQQFPVSLTSPPIPGQALCQIALTNLAASGGATAYVMPRGNTASANPGNVIAAILPQQTIAIPPVVLPSSGIVPENFCLDQSGSTPINIVGFGVVS